MASEPDSTNTIAAAIVAGMGTIALSIRWSVGRMTKSGDRAVAALVDNAKSHATLAVKFDTMMTRFESLANRFDSIVDILLRDPKISESQRAKIASKLDEARTATPTTGIQVRTKTARTPKLGTGTGGGPTD